MMKVANQKSLIELVCQKNLSEYPKNEIVAHENSKAEIRMII